MRGIQRIAGMIVVAAAACQGVHEAETEQATKTTSCVLDTGQWQKQLIWPVSSLALGTVSYSVAQLRAILAEPTHGNGLIALAQELIAAKLNHAMGASAPDFVATIAAADALIGALVVPPVGTGFLPTSLTSALASKLGAFDKGSKNAGPCVGPEADLALAKTVSNATPNLGDTITFTVTLANSGPVDATGVAVSDALPAGLTFVASTPSQGSYDATTGAWTVGTVTIGTPQTLQIQARVISPSAQTNTATISASDQLDPDTTNNTASATETPQAADLAITKTVSNATPNVGDTVTFAIDVSDLGPGDATNAAASDQLPTGLTFVSASASQGSYSATSGAWTIGTLANGADATLTIAATVAASGTLVNSAAISHSDQFDPDTTNNSASATIVAP